MEKIKADEYLIKDFEMHYPHLCDDIVEYQRGEPFELIAKLNDGRVLSYYMPDDLIRYLPSESDMDDEEKCKREFGIRLRHAMHKAGLLQYELAEATGIPQSRLSTYINGKMLPSFMNLMKITQALGCSMNDFQIFRKF